ncbi:MAG TPA: lysine--tRNA ligase [Alphaproteobacteria bacterium]|jgi:lysyl-tRNA synthetase class 1|nr:lysine--tRNA ligase [Alphaproteobacteria bacterium]HJO89109.1 lysine--tRNA ligase [Alphaproteobacteria bacterium]|tara:strand:+ start:4416 stop:6008 length:1593 start_codon:yes stop_codon:yes gene_type:complete
MTDISELANNARAWPFEEARKLLSRTNGETPEKGYVLFETGYGPSGLPHIGTFGEVVRTSMVCHAFATLSDIPTRLYTFSDDMDGLRKVPDNVPNRDMVAEHLGKPLTAIPDPFGTHESFGHHNNARLRAFLDPLGFDYEFQSATEWYQSGRFDDVLLKMLVHFEEVREIILPTLGKERQTTYSPFLPVCAKTGKILQAPVVATDVDAGTITYRDEETGEMIETPVTGGHCKMQWKADWAMRWMALGVDYEMSGKDLIDSIHLSGKIARLLGVNPPESCTYELFLDENGEKISKSRGNGLTVEDWLKYAPQESLSLFMYHRPRRAKRLYFDVIPKNVDEYLTFLGKFKEEDDPAHLENPVWHIHNGTPPQEKAHLSFSTLLNLAGVCHAHDKKVLWGFISRYAPETNPENDSILDTLVGHAITYFNDFVKPTKRYRAPDDIERRALEDLVAELEGLDCDADDKTIQTHIYEVGKRHPFGDLKSWFGALYQILLGQEQGPRMGSFVALYGISETVTLIKKALAGEDLEADG